MRTRKKRGGVIKSSVVAACLKPFESVRRATNTRHERNFGVWVGKGSGRVRHEEQENDMSKDEQVQQNKKNRGKEPL